MLSPGNKLIPRRDIKWEVRTYGKAAPIIPACFGVPFNYEQQVVLSSRPITLLFSINLKYTCKLKYEY